MLKCQFAISSNGRTTFELAHLGLPSIVISQHRRELTHNFSTEENGFINLGLFQRNSTLEKIYDNIQKIILCSNCRKKLHTKMKKFNFNKNKKIIKKIIS